MPLDPLPENAQIEAVREIAHLYSFAQAEKLINGQEGIAGSGLNDVQWAATVADIAEWAKIKNKHTQIRGDGVDINKDRNRLDITIRVRRRLGVYPANPSDGDGDGYVSYTAPMFSQKRR